MALQKKTKGMSEKKSMIELAELILTNEKKELAFRDLFDEISNMKKLTESQKNELLSRFYTDLNLDGRFMALGSNVWGLKKWYPAKQTTEKSLAATRKREQEELDEELLESELDLDEDNEEDNDKFGYYEEAGFEDVEEE